MEITMSAQAKSALTRRENLEREFGVPFDQAVKVRMKYYQMGYGAAKESLKRENESLKVRLSVTLQRLADAQGRLLAVQEPAA